jgi:hypothetical protein
MKAKKTTRKQNTPRVLNGIDRAVIERRKETEDFVKFAKKLMRDPAACRRIAQEAGIFTKAGRLTKRYR